MLKRIFFIVLFTLVGIGVIFAFFSLQKNVEMTQQAKLSSFEATPNIFPAPADLGGPFTLLTHKGELVTDKTFHGKVVLMFFGYTYCPDYCPMELQNLTEVLKLLDKDRLGDKVQPIFITIDPKRDTKELLAGFVKRYDPRVIALTGKDEDLESLRKAYKVFTSKVDDGSDFYLMDHSTFLYLIDQQGKLVSMVRYGTEPAEIAAAVKELLMN